MLLEQGEPMKKLVVLFVWIMLQISCKGITEPQETPTASIVGAWVGQNTSVTTLTKAEIQFLANDTFLVEYSETGKTDQFVKGKYSIVDSAVYGVFKLIGKFSYKENGNNRITVDPDTVAFNTKTICDVNGILDTQCGDTTCDVWLLELYDVDRSDIRMRPCSAIEFSWKPYSGFQYDYTGRQPYRVDGDSLDFSWDSDTLYGIFMDKKILFSMPEFWTIKYRRKS